ncbi:MAG: ferritin family protein [Nanoarchaeota archaeon]|nr:ferritin family protein [Nanoarchaeota archaeon]
MASVSTIEAIKTALQNEEKSVELYQEAAKRTQNPIVKKTMLFLAKWEKQHIEKIKKLNARIIGEMHAVDIKTECSEDPMCVVKDFFSKNIDDFKEKLKGEPEDIKVYETGMEIEKQGYVFYKKAKEDTDDEEAGQLFEFLAKEENIHYKFLEDQHSYISDPESWYLDEEKWILEG